jgi:hypothetical protein
LCIIDGLFRLQFGGGLLVRDGARKKPHRLKPALQKKTPAGSWQYEMHYYFKISIAHI